MWAVAQRVVGQEKALLGMEASGAAYLRALNRYQGLCCCFEHYPRPDPSRFGL